MASMGLEVFYVQGISLCPFLTAVGSPLSLLAMVHSTRSAKPYLAPYAARWVALVRGAVVGVGWTSEEARRAAKLSRPKEEPEVVFVPAGEVMEDEDPTP